MPRLTHDNVYGSTEPPARPGFAILTWKSHSSHGSVYICLCIRKNRENDGVTTHLVTLLTYDNDICDCYDKSPHHNFHIVV